MLVLIAGGAWFITHDSGGEEAPQTTAGRGDTAAPSVTTGQPPDKPADSDIPVNPAHTNAPRHAGPLAVSAGFVNQPCSGDLVVVLASSGEPADYESTIGSAVDAVPAAKYLRTDQSCATFNASLDGHPIYAAYVGPFTSLDEACQARVLSGLPDSYVRTLALDRPLREICSCQDSPDVLPRLSVTTAGDPPYDLRLRVVDVQSMLYSAGFNDANILTGFFGSETDAQVRSFQSAAGLDVDGWVGPDTWAALLASECP